MTKLHTIIHIALIIFVLSILGYQLITPQKWWGDFHYLGAGVAIVSLVISALRKVPSGLMFLFSSVGMVYAVLYWPLSKPGSGAPMQKVKLVEIYPSVMYFAFFLIFGYLYWLNRKRW